MIKFLLVLFSIFSLTNAIIHPIEIRGNHFYDSITNKPFFIKGVDYQPGGSSGVNEHSDPLSDPGKCTRDIYLFQELGINTIRVYSVNPSLDHDKCMTLLAAAGIYLVLDVNSPLEGQHLNRYEPWTTYTERYVSHVYNVVNEFSGYNNTLAFFAGNEIVNDQISASNSPVYIKAVIRDMKHFMKSTNLRTIPVGYSAADDLSYRISLAEYLECYENDELETVDFYGVNTYQWCGDQTFQSSGYNTLVRDYAAYTKPIFFSEYGCNEVLPRVFKEVEAIYSAQMTSVFSGGLVYEFAQEPNNYGLVDYDEWGNVQLLPDFYTFKDQISKVKDVKLSKKLILQNQKTSSTKMDRKKGNASKKMCELQYTNLDVSKGIPRSLGISIAKSFSAKTKGKFVALSQEEMVSHYKVFAPDGQVVTDELVVKPVPEPTSDVDDSTSGEYNDDEDSGNDEQQQQIPEARPIRPSQPVEPKIPESPPIQPSIPIVEHSPNEMENNKNGNKNGIIDKYEPKENGNNDGNESIDRKTEKKMKKLKDKQNKKNDTKKIRKTKLKKAKVKKAKKHNQKRRSHPLFNGNNFEFKKQSPLSI